jgi:Type VI secretion system, TssF
MAIDRHYIIKDRMMQSAARIWGLSETETDGSFDPLVALLMGACATELGKINDEIENSRSRVLERLVQLLSPEALTGVLPAHAIATVLPTEQSGEASPEDQFYVSRPSSAVQEEKHNGMKDIFFSPVAKFLLHKAVIKYKVACNRMSPASLNNINPQPIILSKNSGLPVNQLWLGIEAATLDVEGLRFYFDVSQQSKKKHFFDQLANSQWYAGGNKLDLQTGYPGEKDSAQYFDIDAVLNRNISVTEKIAQHIHQFYQHQFVTLQQPCPATGSKQKKEFFPEEIIHAFEEKELLKIKSGELYWLCIVFPENIDSDVLEDIIVGINCFPVVNRRLFNINFSLRQFINIIPLQSEESFLDLFTIADQQGKLLHLRNDNDEDNNDLSILFRYGGVGRFDKREADEIVDKLIQLLREETAAFSVLGNDFLKNEMTSLQQTLNKLDRQVANKQLLKGSTPFLIVNNNITDAHRAMYVKFWASNGVEANSIKAGTPMNVYSNQPFETGTAILVTTTQGGRNTLSDSEKVLAYKTALLSKQKLVTNEDIAAFCRWRLAFTEAEIQIKKGSEVMPGQGQGLVRTLEIHVLLNQRDAGILFQKGTPEFWQSDLETAIALHANFFIPVRVFIVVKKNKLIASDKA